MLIPPCLSIQSKQLPAVRALPKARTDHLPIATKKKGWSPLKLSFPEQYRTRGVLLCTQQRYTCRLFPSLRQSQGLPALMYLVLRQLRIPGLPAVESFEGRFASPLGEGSAATTGSANFERDQSEVMVGNAHITATSVVVVVLTADPGPVVVQYVLLQPAVGFTVHLSAPAKNSDDLQLSNSLGLRAAVYSPIPRLLELTSGCFSF